MIELGRVGGDRAGIECSHFKSGRQVRVKAYISCEMVADKKV